MDRMHPQDLRAKLAMEFYKLAAMATETEDRSRDMTIQWSVGSADLLLAELARTAKPEMRDSHHCECGASWHRPRWTHMKDCPNYFPNPEEPAPKPELATGCHRAHPHEDNPECPSNLAFHHGYREGAKAERGRIISLIESWNLNNALGYRVGGPTLRAALEPKS